MTPGGYLAIDIDPGDGGLETLAAMEGQYGPRPTGRDDRTRDGLHLAYSEAAPRPLNDAPPVRACDDCTGRVIGGHLGHDVSCPWGLAMDRRSDADRDWFEEHPEADQFFRDIDHAELMEMRATGILPSGPGTVIGRMYVALLGPGLRLCGTVNLSFTPTYDYGDEALR